MTREEVEAMARVWGPKLAERATQRAGIPRHLEDEVVMDRIIRILLDSRKAAS